MPANTVSATAQLAESISRASLASPVGRAPGCSITQAEMLVANVAASTAVAPTEVARQERPRERVARTRGVDEVVGGRWDVMGGTSSHTSAPSASSLRITSVPG